MTFEERNIKLMTLEEVRKLCTSISSCWKCPLHDKDGCCPFMGVSPNNWRLE